MALMSATLGLRPQIPYIHVGHRFLFLLRPPLFTGAAHVLYDHAVIASKSRCVLLAVTVWCFNISQAGPSGIPGPA